MVTDLHTFIYMGLVVAYCEAALQSFAERNYHCAGRELVIACLYGFIGAQI